MWNIFSKRSKKASSSISAKNSLNKAEKRKAEKEEACTGKAQPRGDISMKKKEAEVNHTLEEVCNKYPLLGEIIADANPDVKEVIKRTLGIPSPFLGKGPTKYELLQRSLKFIVSNVAKMSDKLEEKKAHLTAEGGEENEGMKPEDNTLLPEETEQEFSEMEQVKTNAHEQQEITVIQTTVETKAEEGFQQVNKKRLCRNYIRNKCKWGTECRFAHPDMCPTFAKFGPQRETNQKGCNQKKCDLLHIRSKWCMKAIRFNKCLNPKCGYQHFRGVLTKEKMEGGKEKKEYNRVQSNATTGKPRSSPQYHQNRSYASVTKNIQENPAPRQPEPNSFLDANSLGLQHLMMELMARMSSLERKIQWGGTGGSTSNFSH